jgi:uncharacterized membrane protein
MFDGVFIVILIVLVLAVPVALVGFVLWLIFRGRKGRKPTATALVVSKEDLVSQLLIAAALGFGAVTLLSLDHDLRDIVGWSPIVLVLLAAGYGVAYKLRAEFILLAAALGSLAWWAAQADAWADADGLRQTGGLLGLMLAGLVYYVLGRIAEASARYLRLSYVLTIVGLVTFVGALFYLSSYDGLRALEAMGEGGDWLGAGRIVGALAVAALGLVAALAYAVRRQRMPGYEAAAVGGLALLAGLLLTLPIPSLFVERGELYYYVERTLTDVGVIYAIVLNLATLLLLIGLLLLGYLRQRAWLVNLGAFALFVFILFKYFDWFFSDTDKSLFFLGAGVLMLVTGWLMERGRRFMVASIEKQEGV